MKKHFRILASAATVSFLALTTLAQNSPDRTLQKGTPRVTDGHALGQFGPTEKANKVIGMEVKNYQNEKLGKVEDLGIDLESGRIAHVVLSIGGFLGIGDTLIAVPPGALHCDFPNKILHLDADKEKLKAAPRFEMTKWEEHSQPGQVRQVYSYYGQQPYFSTADDKETTLNPDRTKDVTATVNSGVSLGHLQKASKLIGMNVKNLQDEKLGKVDNFIVDLPAGRVTTVIVSSGGFLGLGDELSAIPPTVLRYNTERDTVVLDTTKEALAKAPHFKSSEWPNLGEAAYNDEVYRAYRVEPYFRKNAVADVDNTGRNTRDRDSQTLTPGDQGNSSSDLQTSMRIRREIIASKDMSASARNVKIITVNGRVTLRGPVKTEQEKQLINEIAGRIAQPQNVDNQLEVKLLPTGQN